jgi:DNA-binding transcriptional MerR regulator/methylmalonyl-CoA mutase cobalamin-binding subunit
VSTGLRLNEYATTPLYNIKAVVQATGISPSTLRAWERRYNVASPQRSDSGNRLYTERDVAVIRWLKLQVDAGMSISQAVLWLENLVNSAGDMERTVLPMSGGGTTPQDPLNTGTLNTGNGLRREQNGDIDLLQQDLINALISFKEDEAEVVIAEAFSMYSVEQVGEKLIMPVLVELGERWHRSELSIISEHFATNYLIQRLGTLLRFIPNGTGGPLLWIGCAPSELHEVGALLLAIYLRRLGYRIHYLGQNLPIEDFTNEVKRQQPAMLLLSASTVPAAEELAHLTNKLAQLGQGTPIIGFGGQIFNRRPDLRTNIAGIYLGASAQEAVQRIDELLLDKNRQDKKLPETKL